MCESTHQNPKGQKISTKRLLDSMVEIFRAPGTQIFQMLELKAMATEDTAQLAVGQTVELLDDSLMIGPDPGVPICNVFVKLVALIDKAEFLSRVKASSLQYDRFRDWAEGLAPTARFWSIEPVTEFTGHGAQVQAIE